MHREGFWGCAGPGAGLDNPCGSLQLPQRKAKLQTIPARAALTTHPPASQKPRNTPNPAPASSPQTPHSSPVGILVPLTSTAELPPAPAGTGFHRSQLPPVGMCWFSLPTAAQGRVFFTQFWTFCLFPSHFSFSRRTTMLPEQHLSFPKSVETEAQNHLRNAPVHVEFSQFPSNWTGFVVIPNGKTNNHNL